MGCLLYVMCVAGFGSWVGVNYTPVERRSGGFIVEKRKKRKRVPAKTQWAERSAEQEELPDLIELAG